LEFSRPFTFCTRNEGWFVIESANNDSSTFEDLIIISRVIITIQIRAGGSFGTINGVVTVIVNAI